MAKLLCPCGNTLGNASEYEYERSIRMLISYTELETIESQKTELDEETNYPEVWKCEECGRIAVDKHTDDKHEVDWYKPEKEDAPKTWEHLTHQWIKPYDN